MKKFFFLVLLVTFSINTWSQNLIQKKEYYDYWNTKIKKTYSEDKTTGLKNGAYILYDKKGRPILKLNYKKDKYDGLQYLYIQSDDDDDLQSFFSLSSIESQLDGTEGEDYKINYCNSPFCLVNYKNGKKEGWKKIYSCSPTYRLKKEIFYVNGLKKITKEYNISWENDDGGQDYFLESFSKSYNLSDISYQLIYWTCTNEMWKYYDKDSIKQYYKNGKECIIKSGNSQKIYNKNGKLIEWIVGGINQLYPNGQIKEKGDMLFFENGQIKQSGDTTFYASGRIKSIGQNWFYYENGSLERHGDTTFFQNGKIETLGDDIIFYETGIKKQSGDTTFFQNGKIATIGKNIVYYENGNLKTDGVNKYFENGKPEYFKDASYERTYNNSGQLLSEKNLTTGEYIENYPNGSLKLKTCYNKEGRLNGYYQKYDEQGSLTEFTLYAAGEKQTVNMDIVYKAFRDFFGTTKKSDYISIGDAPMEYYSPNSTTKLIYSKGDKLMGSYKESYADETSNEKRNNILKNAVNALTGLKALADKNTEQMQEELKQAKTVDDIEGFLYYYDTVIVQSGNITQKYLTLQSDKSKISTIGKDQYKVISSEYKEYIKMFYCKTKFDKGAILLEKLDKAVK